MNIPKTAKLGLACAAALSYSVIPTYLLKYRWIFRSRQRASREEKVLYLTFDDGPIPESTPFILETLIQYIRIYYSIFWRRNRFRQHFSWLQDLLGSIPGSWNG